MARASATFSCRHRTCGWLSIPKARSLSAAPFWITAMICKKGALKSPIPTPLRTAGSWRGDHDARRTSHKSDELHLHNFRFLVLEMIVDRFDETVGELLHFLLHIAQLVLGQLAGGLEFLRLVQRGAPVGADAHAGFLGHFAQGTHQFFASLF